MEGGSSCRNEGEPRETRKEEGKKLSVSNGLQAMILIRLLTK